MRKIKLLIIIMICLFITNVKADMGPPAIASHKVMVTNKNGAKCESGGEVIPYKTILEVSEDIRDNYIFVVSKELNDDGSEKYSCYVKYSDVSAVNQNFTITKDNATKLLSAKKAVVLASGGLNMRKGPSVTYGKVTTIPEKTIINVDYLSGEQWYHTTYKDKSGWVTGMDNYLGFENSAVLIYPEPQKIYAANGKTVLGTIPANTEITDYLELSSLKRGEFDYFVSYKNIKGYIGYMYKKVDGVGKIRLTSDNVIEHDANGKATKKLNKGQEYEYTMYDNTWEDAFYIPSLKTVLTFGGDATYEYIQKANVATKTSGYIGEGLFGEEKLKKEEITTPKDLEVIEEEDNPVVIEEEKTLSTKDMIIIGLLAGILLALTALVIIKLVNSKKKKEVVKPKEEVKEESNFEKITDKEIAEARVELIKKIKNLDNEEDNNKEV